MTELNIDLVKYDITAPSIAEMKEQFSGMVITDPESYKAVAQAISVVRGHRTAVEKRRKELKAESLEFGRMVDSRAKEITASLIEIEDPLKATKKVEDDKEAVIEAEKKAKEQERVDMITARIADIAARNSPDVINMESGELVKIRDSLIDLEIKGEDFEEFSEQAERIKANVLTVIQKALDERLVFEAAAVKAKEQADLITEAQAAQEATAKALDEREAEFAKKENEIQRRVAEIKAEEDRIEREEFERKAEEEALTHAEKVTREKAAIEEIERVEREKAETAEAARREALKPDKERLEAFAGFISKINGPDLQSSEAVAALSRFQIALDNLITDLKSDIENL